MLELMISMTIIVILVRVYRYGGKVQGSFGFSI